MTTTKTCSKCKLEHELGHFFRDKYTKDGLTRSCKTCRKESDRKKHLRSESHARQVAIDTEKELLLASGMKDCWKCKERKTLENFCKAKSRRNGINETCRKCSALVSKEAFNKNRNHYVAYRKDWKEKNSEKVKQQGRARFQDNKDSINSYKREWRNKNKETVYLKDHQRRLKIRSSASYISFRDARWLRNEPCIACKSVDKSSIEHLIPVSRNGTNQIGNLSILCIPCNASKCDLTFSEWKYSDRPRAREVFPGLWEKRLQIRKIPHAA